MRDRNIDQQIMINEIAILPATLNDLDQIVQLEIDGFHEDEFQHWKYSISLRDPRALPPAFKSWIARRKYRSLEDPFTRLLVAFHIPTSTVVGFAQWHIPRTHLPALSYGTKMSRFLQRYVDALEDSVYGQLYFNFPHMRTLQRKTRSALDAAIGPDELYWHLHLLVVDKAYRGQRIGSKLYLLLFDYLREKLIFSLRLESGLSEARIRNEPVYLESSPAGKNLYIHHGFRPTMSEPVIVGYDSFDQPVDFLGMRLN